MHTLDFLGRRITAATRLPTDLIRCLASGSLQAARPQRMASRRCFPQPTWVDLSPTFEAVPLSTPRLSSHHLRLFRERYLTACSPIRIRPYVLAASKALVRCPLVRAFPETYSRVRATSMWTQRSVSRLAYRA